MPISIRRTFQVCPETASIKQLQALFPPRNIVTGASPRAFLRDAINLAAKHGQKINTVMICGIGKTPDELILFAEKDLFPDVSRLIIVDWHRPNLEMVEDYAKRNSELKSYEIDLYEADLRSPRVLLTECVDLAYTNKVFSLYEKEEPEKNIGLIALGIHYSLKPGGILCSFEEINFETQLTEVGFLKVLLKVYMKRCKLPVSSKEGGLPPVFNPPGFRSLLVP